MRKISIFLVSLLLIASLSVASASESDISIMSEDATIALYPGQSGIMEFTVSAEGFEEPDSTPASTGSGTTTTASPTYPPTTTPGVPVPPDPPSSSSSLVSASSSGPFAYSGATASLYSMLSYPTLSLKYDMPDGIEVEFESESVIVPLNSEKVVEATVSVDDSLEYGSYTGTVTVRSNAGHSATIPLYVDVKPFIDIVLFDLVVSPDDAAEGDTVFFCATAINNGDEATGPITCSILDRDSGDVLASQGFGLAANSSGEVTVAWTCIEGIYDFKAEISSPYNERITYNNILFGSIEIGACDDTASCAYGFYLLGIESYENGDWESAFGQLESARSLYQSIPDAEMAALVDSYLEMASAHVLAGEYYQLGIEAEATGDLALAEGHFKAAEVIYTELGDRDGINMCFTKLLDISSQGPPVTYSSTGSFPWFAAVVPLVIIFGFILYMGYAKRRCRSRHEDFDAYEILVKDLEKQVFSGELTREEFERLCIRLKEKLASITEAQGG